MPGFIGDMIPVAAAVVDGAGAAQNSRNCTVANNGVGDQQVELGDGVAENECHISTETKTLGATCNWVHTSDTSKQALLADAAGAAAAVAFSFVAYKIQQTS